MGVREITSILVYMSPFNLRTNFDVALNLFMSMSGAFTDEKTEYCFDSLKDQISAYNSRGNKHVFQTDIIDGIHHCKSVLLDNYRPQNGLNLSACSDVFNELSLKVKELLPLSDEELKGYKYDWTLTTLVHPMIMLDLSVDKEKVSEDMVEFLLRLDEPLLDRNFLEILQNRLNELASAEVALLAESVQRERAELAASERNQVILQASHLIGALSQGEDVRISVRDFNKKIEDILGLMEIL